jgi:hypothetical protein
MGTQAEAGPGRETAEEVVGSQAEAGPKRAMAAVVGYQTWPGRSHPESQDAPIEQAVGSKILTD